MDFANNQGTFGGTMGMGVGVPQGTGFQFNGMQPNQTPVIRNFLNQEEINRLIQKENQFSLAISETDQLRATCNHRFNDGRDAIVTNAEGRCVCQICGYEFDPLDESTNANTLNEVVKTTLDVLQTIKLFYLDMAPEVAKQYFQIIPLIEKIPKLFEMAVKSYSKYEQFNPYGFNNRNMNTMQMYSMLAGILGGQQPMYNMNMQAPNMGMGMQPNAGGMNFTPNYQQPNMGMGMQPMMGQPYTAANSNGFVNTGAYQPTTQGVSYVPNADPSVLNNTAQQVATPAADIKTDGTVEATQSFSV